GLRRRHGGRAVSHGSRIGGEVPGSKFRVLLISASRSDYDNQKCYPRSDCTIRTRNFEQRFADIRGVCTLQVCNRLDTKLSPIYGQADKPSRFLIVML